jgi:hypothetical protein
MLENFPAEKYFQFRKIANRTKLNTFFDIQKPIPDPCYTRLKFLANMSYACHHRSTAVTLLFEYILAQGKVLMQTW